MRWKLDLLICKEREHRIWLYMLTQDAEKQFFFHLAACLDKNLKILTYSPGHTLLVLWAAELYADGHWTEKHPDSSGCLDWGIAEQVQICHKPAASPSHQPPCWQDAEVYCGLAIRRLESKSQVECLMFSIHLSQYFSSYVYLSFVLMLV